jgi:anti-anti-sigma factor
MEFESAHFKALNDGSLEVTLGSYFFESDPSKLVIGVDGLLNTDNAEDFRDAVVSTLKEADGVKAAAFDLSKLSYISSTGIGSFTVIQSEAKRAGISLCLFGITEKVQSIFDNLGFTSFFVIKSSVQEAF